MNGKLRDGAMIAGMVVAWSVFYAVSKHMVDATGSPFAAGFLLRLGALAFLTVQLVADGQFKGLFHQGRAALLLAVIGAFGFLLDLFANLGYAGGTLSTGTALLKTDVLMVNLITVAVYHKKLYLSDWLGSFVMLLGVVLGLGLDFRSFAFRPADLFFLLSALCVTVNAFLIKAAQEKHGRDTDSISYYNNFTVLVLFAAFALMRGDLQALAPAAIPHFAPCRVRPEGFNCLVVLTEGTNSPLPHVDPSAPGEAGLLWMRNKWLLCHRDSPQAQKGAFVGITGENLQLAVEKNLQLAVEKPAAGVEKPAAGRGIRACDRREIIV